MKELLANLTGIYGPSGNEQRIREAIENEVRDYVDEIHTDALGNLIAVKKGPGKKIMLAAHMDQIGLIVTNIDEDGFLRFTNVGNGGHEESEAEPDVYRYWSRQPGRSTEMRKYR